MKFVLNGHDTLDNLYRIKKLTADIKLIFNTERYTGAIYDINSKLNEINNIVENMASFGIQEGNNKKPNTKALSQMNYAIGLVRGVSVMQDDKVKIVLDDAAKMLCEALSDLVYDEKV